MPLIFMFMFSGMPAGLILYWCCSNIFTIFQQAVILHNTPNYDESNDVSIEKKHLKKRNDSNR